MAVIRELLYLGRDNTIDIRLMDAGVSKNLTNATKIQVTFGSGVTIDSETSPTLFSGVTSTTGAVSFTFGSLSYLASGATYNAEVIVYDGGHLSGTHWGTIPVKVIG